MIATVSRSKNMACMSRVCVGVCVYRCCCLYFYLYIFVCCCVCRFVFLCLCFIFYLSYISGCPAARTMDAAARDAIDSPGYVTAGTPVYACVYVWIRRDYVWSWRECVLKLCLALLSGWDMRMHACQLCICNYLPKAYQQQLSVHCNREAKPVKERVSRVAFQNL